MKPFILTPRAEQDVTDIWDYIAADNIEAADRKHRFFPVYSYLIVYRFETRPLQVIRVLHGTRDVRSVLRPTSGEE